MVPKFCFVFSEFYFCYILKKAQERTNSNNYECLRILKRRVRMIHALVFYANSANLNVR